MGNHLPADIIMDILSRLPAESVLKCRRVCKTWQSLTYHPSFANLHLHHSLQLDHADDDDDDDDDGEYHKGCFSRAAAKVGFVSSIWFKDRNNFQLYYGEYDDQNDDESYKTLTKINHPPLDFNSCMFVGSCNGLICSFVRHNGIKDPVYIFNPITREYIYIPIFTRTHVFCRMYSGFGYHPKTNEYKVVRIFSDGSIYSDGLVQVYTLGSGTGWRNKGVIECHVDRDIGVLANGALHWRTTMEGKILSFDLENEEFYLIPSPPCPDHNYLMRVLGGLLCAIHKKDGECVNIWSLKKKTKKKGTITEMGNEQASLPWMSWTWSYEFSMDGEGTITEMGNEQDSLSWMSWTWSFEFCMDGEGISTAYFMDDYNPFALTKNGKLLMWYRRMSLSCYNLKTTFLELLATYALDSASFEAIPHINSFISLKALGEDAKIIGSAEGVLELQNN